MSSVAYSGTAGAEFRRLTSAFTRVYGGRKGVGASLAVYRHGEPILDIWTGESAPERAWTRDTGAMVFSATKAIASTVVHRLADRGLIDYDAPVAEYWPEFGCNKKDCITVRQILTHSAGLSGVGTLAAHGSELLDHELMAQRLAAATPDRLLGVPAYHAMTYGWLLAGLTRAITGASMKELFAQEVAEPLGIEGIYLGRPPAGSLTLAAESFGTGFAFAGTPRGARLVTLLQSIPGVLGVSSRSMFIPGAEAILAGPNPPVLDSEMPAANGVCTANGLAAMYEPLACDGMAGGQRYLSGATMQAIRRIERYRPDTGLFLYMGPLWHLGYHSMPTVGAPRGFGHIGLGGSFGWADPDSGISVGFTHNRLSLDMLALDQPAFAWLLPLVMAGARSARRIARSAPREAAA
ncbi:serine hydrolase domain-containing protein [Nocardia sp. NPDC051750]|uniref:serine hydrolase domain-containing protein n=1 Tax=Nocardia sp. NPDC051750 TaxID=3364325 RepID=UPI0037BCADFF